MTFQLQENSFRELISRKLHITYSFVIQRITWKNCFGKYFLGKSHFSYMNNVFGINFAIISESVRFGGFWASSRNAPDKEQNAVNLRGWGFRNRTVQQPVKVQIVLRVNYHWRHNHYSQLSYFSELISITVSVTVTVIIFPGINYITVMNSLQNSRN